MAIEIESFLRAVVRIRNTTTTVYQWGGQGVSNVQHLAVGEFLVTLDEGVDISQAVAEATPETLVSESYEGSYCEVLPNADGTEWLISVFSTGGGATASLADPRGLSFTVSMPAAELPAQAVA